MNKSIHSKQEEETPEGEEAPAEGEEGEEAAEDGVDSKSKS